MNPLVYSESPGPRVLPDPWEPGSGVPLDGGLERHRFSPVLMAGASLLLIFFLFQVVVAPLVLVVLMVLAGVDFSGGVDLILTTLTERPVLLMVANTVGQILGIALPAWLLARLHSSRPAALLRLRPPDRRLLGLAVFGFVALVPWVQWLARVSEALPWPESVRAFEQPQIDLIEKLLEQNLGFLPTLFMLAITPAFCEELFFRGYFQRQVERAWGAAGGVLVAGVLFGLFHLRPTQTLPLAVLGVYLAYLTWRTGSLWPAMVVHFANNGLAVVLGAYVQARPDLNVEDLEHLAVPWYVLVPVLVFFLLGLYAMDKTARGLLREKAQGEASTIIPTTTTELHHGRTDL